MKQMDALALAVMAGVLYISCAIAGLWWRTGTKPLVAVFILAFAIAVATERGYKGYWRIGFKKTFLFVYALPIILGLVGFLYGTLVISG